MAKKPRFDCGQGRRTKGAIKNPNIMRVVKLKLKPKKKLWRA